MLVEDIRIENSRIEMGLGIGLSLATFSVRNFDISNVTMGSIIIPSLSSGQCSDISATSVVFDMHIFQGNKAVANFTNILLTHIHAKRNQGIQNWSRSTIHVSNLTVKDSTAKDVMQASYSWMQGVDIKVERCSVAYMFGGDLSDMSFENYIASESTGRIMQLVDTSITIAHASFRFISAYASLIDSAGSHISLIDVQCFNLTTNSQAGKLWSGNTWLIRDSLFQGLNANGVGFEIVESSLTVTSSTFRYFNFGLFQCKNSNITLTKARVEYGRNPVQSLRSRAAYGGALSCMDCPQVTLQEVKFLNVTAAVGGAVAVRRHSEQGGLLVKYSTFTACSALQGGALFIQNVTFTIDGSLFVFNTATESGGAIFAAIKSWQQGLISHTHFRFNSAYSGGGVKWSNAEVRFINATFQENSAIYGSDIASYGVKLSPRLTNVNGSEASGQALTLIFELQDHYGHRVHIPSYKFLILLPTSVVSYRGNNGRLLNQGLFTYSDFIIYAPPGSTQVIQSVLLDTQEDISLSIKGEISLSFRNCIAGEVELIDRCEYCNAGNVSFDPSDSQCSFCPANAFCPGGNQLLVNPHYWRRALNSTALHLCPYPDKCLGGANSTCAPGFTGPLCSVCEEGHTIIRAVECIDCAFVGLQICCSIATCLFFIWAFLRVAAHPNIYKLHIFKTVVHHFQILSSVSFMRVSYSRMITWCLHAASYISSLSIVDLPLSCLRITHPIYGKAIIGSLCYPLFLLISLLVCKLTTTSWQQNTVLLATSVLLYTPAISVSTALPLLVCQTIDTAQEYLSFDTSVPCWTGAHNTYVRALVLPSLLINLLLPLMVIIVFRFLRPQCYKRAFPLWTAGYKLECWDLLSLFFKCLLLATMIANNTYSPLLQVTYCLSILILEITITVSLQEYVFCATRLFFVSVLSLLAVALTLGFSSYYAFYLPGSGGSGYFVDAMMVLINGAYLLLCGYALRRWEKPARKLVEGGIFAPNNTPEISANQS